MRLQVAEIKARQDLNNLNGQYKVEKLERIKQSQLDRAAKKAHHESNRLLREYERLATNQRARGVFHK